MFSEGRLMINPNTIDSVSATLITKQKPKNITIIDSETDSEKGHEKNASAGVGLSCRKRKKE